VGAAPEADEEVTASNGTCRAVVFDLWNTIAAWPHERWETIVIRLAERLGLTPRSSTRAGTGSSRSCARRARSRTCWRGSTCTRGRRRGGLATPRRDAPRPRSGRRVVETITALRERGLKIGLITVCSEDVPLLWEETPFHGLFDAEVFSATCGLRKPDPRIYRLALDQLGVEPEQAVFVGDGANDELAGAERVGMSAVGVDSPGGELPEDWDGPRIRALPELLELV
jgi:putative hydrolase of the HAD superfamily